MYISFLNEEKTIRKKIKKKGKEIIGISQSEIRSGLINILLRSQ